MNLERNRRKSLPSYDTHTPTTSSLCKATRDDLNIARKNLELVKEKDPEYKEVDWRNPLYVVLYALKDRAALKSLAKIMPTEK